MRGRWSVVNSLRELKKTQLAERVDYTRLRNPCDSRYWMRITAACCGVVVVVSMVAVGCAAVAAWSLAVALLPAPR